MGFSKLLKVVFCSVALTTVLLAGLVYVPRMIDVNVRKPYVEQRLSDLTGLNVKIVGPLRFSILPRTSIVASEVNVTDAGGESIMQVDKLYVRLRSFNIFKGDMQIESIVISGGEANLSSLRLSDLEEFLSGGIFSTLMLRDSVIKLPDGGVVSDINATIEGLSGKGLRLIGALEWRGLPFSGIKADISWTDADNFTVSGQAGYSKGRDGASVHGNLMVRAGLLNSFGQAEVSTSDLAGFLSGLGLKKELPDIGLFKGRVDVRSDVAVLDDRISLSKGVIKNAETNGAFSAEIPRGAGRNGAALNINFQSAKLGKLVNIVPASHLNDPMILLEASKPLTGFLHKSALNLSVNNLILQRGVARNISFESKPAITESGTATGFKINRFSFQRDKETFDATGEANFFAGQKSVSLRIYAMPAFDISHPSLGTFPVKGFNGRVIASDNRLEVKKFEATVGSALLLGNASWQKTADGRDDITLALSSDSVPTAKMFGTNTIGLPFVIERLSALSAARVSMRAEFAKLDLGTSGAIRNFALDAAFADGSLKISSLRFTEGARISAISGDMVGLVGKNAGEFRGFRYRIISGDGKGMRIPFIGTDNFVANLMQGGVSSADISLEGDAANPVAVVSARGNGIEVSVNGRLLGPSGNYSLEFAHPELRGFLFAFGFIDETLADYFYDGIPFKVRAQVHGGTVSDIRLSIKGNELTGAINRDKGATSAAFKSPRLDSRLILKRLPDTEACADFFLRLIRALPLNFALKADVLASYDGNIYNDFALNLRPAANPGSIVLDFKKDGRISTLESEILNSRIFSGTLTLTNYPLPAGFMGTDATVGVHRGTMGATLKFSTNGLNSSQLISNLSGSFELEVRNGIIKGISGYDVISAAIADLASITSNNVVRVISTGLRSGELPFESLRARGAIKNAVIDGAAFELVSKNMSAFGLFSSNLIEKSLSIASEISLSQLSPDAFPVSYRAGGFMNNLEISVDVSELGAKVNTLYLQKKKR